MFCDVCSVSCPSHFNYKQHIAGKKHAGIMAARHGSSASTSAAAARGLPLVAAHDAAGGGTGTPSQASMPCFYWPGRCQKGSSCPFMHDPKATMPTATFLQNAAVVTGEFVLTKAAAAGAPALPAHCHDILKGKQGVNLYLSGGSVVWQFKYNREAIDAIKQHVTDRKWDPSLGDKGSWVAPLKSLPECIALYEHFGRQPDAELKRRAQQVTDEYGLAAAKGVTLRVELTATAGSASTAGSPNLGSLQIGRVIVSFGYDKDVIAAIKLLPPGLRSYNADLRVWPIDLLVLPELLTHLQNEAGYAAPPAALQELSDLCEELDEILHLEPRSPPVLDAAGTGTGTAGSAATATVAAAAAACSAAFCEDAAADFDAALAALDVEALVASQGAAGASQRENMSQQCPDVAAATTTTTAAAAAAAAVAARDAAAEEALEREAMLKESLEKLVRMVGRAGKGASAIDTSDVGQPKKRRKLTAAQKAWSQGGDALDYLSDESDDDAYGRVARATYELLRGYRQNAPPRAAPVGCDCGHPTRLTAGRHVCRYFGHFECATCQNRWTSAFCWKGEGQECRRCGTEGLPYQKDQLDGRPGGNGKPHDSRRCGMCKRLGRDCSFA